MFGDLTFKVLGKGYFQSRKVFESCLDRELGDCKFKFTPYIICRVCADIQHRCGYVPIWTIYADIRHNGVYGVCRYVPIYARQADASFWLNQATKKKRL